MKSFISRVFFASDCARGATFSLTLLTLGNYLWLSFFLMLSLCLGRIYPGISWAFIAGAALLTLYSLALAVIALVQFVKILRRERRFRTLWYLLPAGLCLAAGITGFVRVFPPLMGVGYMVALDFGIVWNSRGFPGLPPEYWAAVFLLSLLLILAGCLLLSAMFTAAAGNKIRSAFGAATLTLWGVLILWYLFTLGLALRESCKASAVRQAVETRFGRPLTAGGLEALYCENGKADGTFWARQEKLLKALPKLKLDKDEDDMRVGEMDFFDLYPPDRPTKATLARCGDYCRDNRAAIEGWERCFDQVPPLPEKRFVAGRLLEVAFPSFRQCRGFARMERTRLICALAAGDADTAWKCYRRIGNVGAYIAKEPFLIGGLVWTAVEDPRLNCVERLLESRLLSDARLDELDADLAALEREIPRNHRQSMYAEAVFAEDVVIGLAKGLMDYSDWTSHEGRVGALAPYRWIFPQYWYQAALDHEALLRIYLAPDLTRVPPRAENRLLFLSRMLPPALEMAGNRYYALTARARGMRALIRAERYRRKHGEFPKELSDLPEDPFTGRPLIYSVGPAEIFEDVWEKPVCVSGTREKRIVNVVLVHGDPAKTIPLRLRKPESGVDPTRALIRR